MTIQSKVVLTTDRKFIGKEITEEDSLTGIIDFGSFIFRATRRKVSGKYLILSNANYIIYLI